MIGVENKAMSTIIGACGYGATGSSAIMDLLREFDNTNILSKIEFILPYFPDGLEDLEYHVRNYHKYMASAVAINRFRKFTKWPMFTRVTNGEIKKLTDDFLSKIVQISWNGRSWADKYIRSTGELFIASAFFTLIRKLRFIKSNKLCDNLFKHKIEISIMSENFDASSKYFMTEILNAMGRDPQKMTVLDQPFEGCNPVKSFKYFENPKAIVVDRDPRDHYLFAKNFLRPRGLAQIPCDNADDYIQYFRLIRKSPLDLRKRDDIIFLNFEELIYDYENAVSRVANFCGVSEHTHKGVYFKPTHSRNNTQLFKKYTGFEEDIAKIERELPEYLFHFENYPDVKAEDGMFYGSQRRKKR